MEAIENGTRCARSTLVSGLDRGGKIKIETRKEVEISVTINWVFKRLAEMDLQLPGLVGHFIRSSDERKQVISCCLALGSHAKQDTGSMPDLIKMGHTEILRFAIECPPQGLRGALRRSSGQLHPRSFYLELLKALKCLSDQQRRTFATFAELTPDVVHIWNAAPSKLRDGRFLSIFSTRSEFDDVLTAVRRLEKAGLNGDFILERLSSARTRSHVGKSFRTLMDQIKFRGFPTGGNPLIAPIRTVSDLKAVALRLRNCSAGYLFDCLDVHSLFYVIQPDNPIGMVHLEKSRGAWEISDIAGPSNRVLPRSVIDGVLQYFQRIGISSATTGPASDWDSLSRVCRMSDRKR